MTDIEFLDWFAYHCRQFPAVAKWNENHPELDGWMYAMRDAGIFEAKSASKAMLAGETDEGFGVSDHPKLLMRWIRKHRSLVESSERRNAVECETCGDSGFVTVYGEKAKRAVVNHRPLPYDIVAARCNCQRNDANTDTAKAQEKTTFYNASTMVAYDFENDHAALYKWAEELKQREDQRFIETGGFEKGETFDPDERIDSRDFTF